MNDYEFRRLRQRAIERDMTDVCRDLGIELSTRGRWRVCRCPNPEHEDRHPSCRVNVNTNRFRCFSCDAHGNNIDLVLMARHCSYNEAVRFITGENVELKNVQDAPPDTTPAMANLLDIQWLHELVSPRDYYQCLSPWAKDFLSKRRIDPNIIDTKGIVSIDRPVATQRTKRKSSRGHLYTPTFPAPSLLFPYRDENDIIINLQARLDKPDVNQQRFHFPPGCHTSLWNPHDALKLPDGSDLWLCEGVSDAMALMTSGRPALAIASATSLTQEASDFIAQQSTRLRLHIYPDNDAPGQRLYQQLLGISSSIRRHCIPDGIKDFGEAWAKGVIESRSPA